jgi:hypothetical protein
LALYHACFAVNPALPLLVLGHPPGTQAVEVVPRPQLERMEARFSARFVPVPKGAPPLTFPDYSSSLVSEVEGLLEQARTEATALNEKQAAFALSAAERLLHAHPELPQAAWLMAERHQIAALLADGNRDPAADALRARARALEPERAAAFGQDVRLDPIDERERVSVEIRGVSARDQLEWDGAERVFPVQTRSGEHLLRVLRDGELAWAGWVSVSPSQPQVDIDIPRAATCSQAEIGATSNGPARPLPPRDVSCPAWAVLRIERGRAQIALCQKSACGVFRADAPVSVLPHPPEPARAEPSFPRWATIAIASAGAALITGVTLWQTGVFEREERGRPRWVYQGFVPPESQ